MFILFFFSVFSTEIYFSFADFFYSTFPKTRISIIIKSYIPQIRMYKNRKQDTIYTVFLLIQWKNFIEYQLIQQTIASALNLDYKNWLWINVESNKGQRYSFS